MSWVWRNMEDANSTFSVVVVVGCGYGWRCGCSCYGLWLLWFVIVVVVGSDGWVEYGGCKLLLFGRWLRPPAAILRSRKIAPNIGCHQSTYKYDIWNLIMKKWIRSSRNHKRLNANIMKTQIHFLQNLSSQYFWWYPVDIKRVMARVIYMQLHHQSNLIRAFLKKGLNACVYCSSQAFHKIRLP